MKGANFDKIIADAYRVEPKTVSWTSRALKEVGLMTTGARGRNAPHLTPRDAGTITMALLATDRPARAVERVERFASIPFAAELSDENALDQLGLPEGTTLLEAVTSLFEPGAGELLLARAPYVEILENARLGRIEYQHEGETREAVFFDEKRDDDTKEADRGELFGIRRARGVATSEIAKVQVQFLREAKAAKEAADGQP